METMKVDKFGRRSRFLNFAPTGKKIVVSHNDQRIFKLLRKYRWLPSNWIVSLLDLYPDWGKKRLRDLRKELGLVFCPKSSWGMDAKTQHAVYGLTPKCELLYGEALKFGNHIKHDLLACLAMASFEVGCKQNSLTLIDWDKLKEREACTSQNWFLPLQGNRKLEPDWPPFALKYNDKAFYIYGVEVDRDTESLKGEAHKTITRMFEDYYDLLGSRAYEAIGLKRPLIPIITTSATRMDDMMATLKLVAGERSTSAFIFCTIPDILTEFYTFPTPNGSLLTSDWYTTKGTFNFLTELKGTTHGSSETR